MPTDPATNPTLAAARSYVAAGLSVIPVLLDGTKRPAYPLLPTRYDERDGRDKATWLPYQSRLASEAELVRWFGGREPRAVAVVGGAVSGGAECVDFDDRPTAAEFRREVEADHPGLAGRLSWEDSPRGAHCWYRCAVVEGNQDLATVPDGSDDRGRPKTRAVIETRGEGGYAVVAGSPLTVSSTGRPYAHSGGPTLANLSEITPDERDYLFRLARSFHRGEARVRPGAPAAGGVLSPADDYDIRGPAFDELLPDATFSAPGRDDGRVSRPGKERGHSATVGYCRGSRGEPLLHVFTSNWAPFEKGGTYGRFQVLRLTRFQGDGREATRYLRTQGFGSPKTGSYSSFPPREKDEYQSNGGAGDGGVPPPSTDPVFAPLVPISELRRGEPGDWLWHGYLSRRSTTLLSALWKAGKTTLLAHLLKSLERGGVFCGHQVRPARVAYVTEESGEKWASRRDELGIGDHVHLAIRPFKVRPRLADWVAYLHHLRGEIARIGAEVAVIDPLTTLWPVDKENEAGLVAEALVPLNLLTEHAAVILSHHLRKGDGAEATGSRGSGALPAFVDTIVELRRFDAADRGDRRRVLTGYGRYDETPGELVIELGTSGYVALGTSGEVRIQSLTDAVLAILPAHEPGWTWQAILEALKEGDYPTTSNTRLLEMLNQGAIEQLWLRSGTGVKGDPLRFRLPPKFGSYSSSPLREKEEYESNGGEGGGDANP